LRALWIVLGLAFLFALGLAVATGGEAPTGDNVSPTVAVVAVFWTGVMALGIRRFIRWVLTDSDESRRRPPH
jgi:hypothetical protein